MLLYYYFQINVHVTVQIRRMSFHEDRRAERQQPRRQ